MELEKLKASNIVVKHFGNTPDPRPVKGADWFDDDFAPYSNIVIYGKKRMGKTQLLINIITHMMTKTTKFLLISTTIDKKGSLKGIVDHLNEKGRTVLSYPDIIDSDGNDLIRTFMDENRDTGEVEKALEIPKNTTRPNGLKISTGKTPNEVPSPVPVKKSKFRPLEWIIVFDDMGQALRTDTIEQLMKTNYHYKAMVLISTQSINDLKPGSISQIDYACLFGEIPDEKLEELYKKLAIPVSFELFHDMYKDATADKYGFLYVDRQNETFRKKFNARYKLPK